MQLFSSEQYLVETDWSLAPPLTSEQITEWTDQLHDLDRVDEAQLIYEAWVKKSGGDSDEIY